jgi:hypothetical protein
MRMSSSRLVLAIGGSTAAARRPLYNAGRKSRNRATLADPVRYHAWRNRRAGVMDTAEQDVSQFRELEERLFRVEVRSSPEALAALLAVDFVEFGRSGLAFDRRSVIDALQQERPVERTISDFSIRRLAENVTLVTYRSARRMEGGQAVHSLRSSIWTMIDGRWQMVFHQGTPTQP